MSPVQCPPLPFETARAAESVFGREHPYLKIGRAFELLWEGLDLPVLDADDTFLSASFYPYSFVTVLQYWEFLTDRQTAHATRTRLDIKYALHLPLSYPGVDASALCEFRQHVLANPQARSSLQRVDQALNGVLERGNYPEEIERMLAAICLPSRAELIFDCMSIALEAIASLDPAWLRTAALPHWFRRYHRSPEGHKMPTNPREIELMILAVGKDGRHLLEKLQTEGPARLSGLPEVQALRDEWQRQYDMEAGGLAFRQSHCFSCKGPGRLPGGISKGKEEIRANT